MFKTNICRLSGPRQAPIVRASMYVCMPIFFEAVRLVWQTVVAVHTLPVYTLTCQGVAAIDQMLWALLVPRHEENDTLIFTSNSAYLSKRPKKRKRIFFLPFSSSSFPCLNFHVSNSCSPVASQQGQAKHRCLHLVEGKNTDNRKWGS